MDILNNLADLKKKGDSLMELKKTLENSKTIVLTINEIMKKFNISEEQVKSFLTKYEDQIKMIGDKFEIPTDLIIGLLK